MTTLQQKTGIWRVLCQLTLLEKSSLYKVGLSDYFLNLLILIHCVIEFIIQLSENQSLFSQEMNVQWKIWLLVLNFALNIILIVLFYRKSKILIQNIFLTLIIVCIFEYFQQTSLNLDLFFIMLFFFNLRIMNIKGSYHLIALATTYSLMRFLLSNIGDSSAIIRFTYNLIIVWYFSVLTFHSVQQQSNYESTSKLLRSFIKKSNEKISAQNNNNNNINDETFVQVDHFSGLQIIQRHESNHGNMSELQQNISLPKKGTNQRFSFSENKQRQLNQNHLKTSSKISQRNNTSQNQQQQSKVFEEKLSPLRIIQTNKVNRVSSFELVSLWKCLDVLSTGMVLIDSSKGIIFKTKAVKQLIGKSNSSMNFLECFYQLPLSMNPKKQFHNVKSDPILNSPEDTQIQKQRRLRFQTYFKASPDSPYCDQKRMNRQKSKATQGHSGSVVCNLYNSQKAPLQDQKSSNKQFGRMATVEVYSKENTQNKIISPRKILKEKPQQITTKNQIKESDIEQMALKNLQANIIQNNKHLLNQMPNILLNSNLNNQSLHQNFLFSDDSINISKQLKSPKYGENQQSIFTYINNYDGNDNQVNSSTNIIQNNNIVLCKNHSNTKSKGKKSISCTSNGNEQNIFRYDGQQNSLNLHFDEFKSKLIRCIIPDTIDRLFQEDDLVLEDIIDFLLENSTTFKQSKFNTENQLFQEAYSSDSASQLDQKLFLKQSNNDQATNDEYTEEQPSVLSDENNDNYQAENSGKEEKIKLQKQPSDSNNFTLMNKSDQQSENKSRNKRAQNKKFIEEKIEDESFSYVNTFSKEKSSHSNGKGNKIIKDDSSLKQKGVYKAKKFMKNPKKDYQYQINNNILHIQVKIHKEGSATNNSSNNNNNNNNNLTFIELKLSCLTLKDNEDKFILIEISDITRLRRQADEDNLRDYKNKMLSSISHELRTPLNCSIQLLDLLAQNDDVPEIIKQVFINPALFSNQLLLNIINDILDLAQINYGKFKMSFQLLELTKICTDCLNLISLQAMQKNLTLELEIDPQIPDKINSDPSRIRQVLLNLLNNALKFTQKGAITIKLNLISENLIQVDVQDTGCGIPQQNLSKIIGSFGRDYQFSDHTISNDKLNTVGAGLGLTIANNLATGLGGNRSLKVQSIENEGSTFSFCIVNHPRNQIGCTFEEKNLFSKQIINWECFSQYSQMIPSMINRKSENWSQYYPHSSSHFHQVSIKKKNSHLYEDNSSTTGNIRCSDATNTILQFNNEIMVNSYCHQSNYFTLTNPMPLSNDASFNNFMDIDQKISCNRKSIQEGSIKKRKYKMTFSEDQNSFCDLRNQLPIFSPSPAPTEYWSPGSNNHSNFNMTSSKDQNSKDFEKPEYSLLHIEKCRPRSVSDASENQANSVNNNQTQQKDSNIALQPIKYRTNSVMVIPTSNGQVESLVKNLVNNQTTASKTSTSQFIEKQQIYSSQNQNLQVTSGDRCNSSRNESSLTSIFENKLSKIQKSSQLQVAELCGENPNLISKPKFMQISNSSIHGPSSSNTGSIQTFQSHNQSYMINGQSQSLSNGTQIKQTENEDESCDIQYALESKNKRMPNEFNFIQLQHKLHHDQKSKNIISIPINQMNEEYQKRRYSSLESQDSQKVQTREYQVNLIYENTSVSQKCGNNSPQNTKVLSSINEEVLNENESSCVTPILHSQKQDSKITNKDYEQNILSSQLLQLPPQKQKQRDSKEENLLNHPIPISPKKSLVSPPKISSNSLSQKVEEKPIITKQIRIQGYNKMRGCKCPNILIVDDNEFNIYALDVRLQSYGFISDKATDGIKALEFVRNKYEQKEKNHCCLYSIIFMDIDMPIKNGYETTKDLIDYFNLQKIKTQTPISACSAYVQDSEKIKAKKAGMKYYITKPINPQMLESVLELCLFGSNNFNYNNSSKKCHNNNN